MQPVLAELQANGGATTLALRRSLAAKAFARTAAYDAAVSAWFAGEIGDDRAAPPRLRRHAAPDPALWREPAPERRPSTSTAERRPGVATARQLQGKELTYNNINDTDAAYELVGGVRSRAHAPPAPSSSTPTLRRGGGRDLEDAYRRALACDPVSAFGGIMAFNRTLDARRGARRSPRSSPK